MKNLLSSIFAVLVLFFSAFSQDNVGALPEAAAKTKELISLTPESRGREIVSLFKEGKLDEAIKLAETEVDENKKFSGASGNYANALFNLAMLYREKSAALKKEIQKAPLAERADLMIKSYDYWKKVENLLRNSVAAYDLTDVKEKAAALEAKGQLAWQLGHGIPLKPNSEVDRARGDEAETLYLGILAARDKKFGRNDQDTLKTILSLADLYARRVKFEEALPLYERYIAALESSPIDRKKELVPVFRILAHFYEATQRHSEALQLAEKIASLTGVPENVPPPTPNLAFRAVHFEIITKTLPADLRNVTVSSKREAPVNRTLYSVTVRILVDENGNVIEAKGDPGEGKIKNLGKYEDLAKKSTFRPFAYNGMKYKMRGIVLYQWFE